MQTRPTRLFALLGAAGLTLTACGTTREDAIEALVDAGFTEETADCVMTDLEAQGYEPSDLEDDNITPALSADIETAMTACFTDEDLTGVIESGDPEEVRQSVIDGMTADGTVTAEQAGCVLDSLESQGVTLSDLSSVGMTGDFSAFQAEMDVAVAACL